MEHLKSVKSRVCQFAQDKTPWFKKAFVAGVGGAAAIAAASFLPCGDKLSTASLTAVGSAGTYMGLHYHETSTRSSQATHHQK